MKTTVKILLFIFFACRIFSVNAQILSLKSNTTDQEKADSRIYKTFNGSYDLLLAYTTESYWWGNMKYYNLLAVKNGIWFKGGFYSKKRKNNKWTKPKISFEEVSQDSARSIIRYLKEKGFYSLNRDTLISTKDL